MPLILLHTSLAVSPGEAVAEKTIFQILREVMTAVLIVPTTPAVIVPISTLFLISIPAAWFHSDEPVFQIADHFIPENSMLLDFPSWWRRSVPWSFSPAAGLCLTTQTTNREKE